ncbi:MAG TPA: hypothetical protein VIN09_06565 [Chloroflexota bacterium]
MKNFVPLPYRRVSYQVADFPLTEEGLRTLVGRLAYRHTDYVVLRRGDAVGVASVEKASREPLFAPITHAAWLSPPERTRFVEDHAVDTGLPSALGAKAIELGVKPSETLVVLGRYEHVNFIACPDPAVVRVVEVVPPEPPKLWDLVQRVLDVAPLAAMRAELERVDLRELAASAPTRPGGLLFPCRASGFASLGVPVHFLDERPPRRDWTLIGCERSRQIHESLYGDQPPSVDFCPRRLVGRPATPTLVKCCLLERGFERAGNVVVVPWGASPEEVEVGLCELVGRA